MLVAAGSWTVPIDPHPSVRQITARASALAGDTAKAGKAFQDFFAVWKDADPDIPILIEAKKDYAPIH